MSSTNSNNTENYDFPMSTKVVNLIGNNESSIFYKRNYCVPEYQRAYAWNDDNIDSFKESILNAINNIKVFMGTIQLIDKGNNSNDYDIVDGQQRITTFLLLLKALGGISNDDVSLNLKNFGSNNDKIKNILNDNYDATQNDNDNDSDIYLHNYNLLKSFASELEKKYGKDQVLEKIQNNIYFVELITKGEMPLSQVISIFNTINTTGLELDSSDLFKLQYYDYLNKFHKYNGENQSWMNDISELYEFVNKENYKMEDILTVYKHCIVASREDFKWDMLSKSNEAFFELILNTDKCKNDEILEFNNFKKLVELYTDFFNVINENLSKDKKNQKLINYIKDKEESIEILFSQKMISQTRYSRYWTIPIVSAYFSDKTNKEEKYYQALKISNDILRCFIVYSVNKDKVINYIQNKMCNKILPCLAHKKYEESTNSINDIINNNENYVEFKNRLYKDLYSNKKRARIICTLCALYKGLENHNKDISSINEFLFMDYNLDIEHIYARNRFMNDFKKTDEDKSIMNGIGNLMLLEQSINRKIQDNDIKDKLNEYKNSKLSIVKSFTNSYKNKWDNEWDIEQIKECANDQIEKILESLNLNESQN